MSALRQARGAVHLRRYRADRKSCRAADPAASARAGSRARHRAPHSLHLKRATLKTGLSWPSLAKALGREVDPKRWAVLYLGCGDRSDFAAAIASSSLLDSKNVPLARAGARLHRHRRHHRARRQLEPGEDAVVAESLGFEMPAPRAQSEAASLYGKLRREPRREGLSTLEAAALALSRSAVSRKSKPRLA